MIEAGKGGRSTMWLKLPSVMAPPFSTNHRMSPEGGLVGGGSASDEVIYNDGSRALARVPADSRTYGTHRLTAAA